MSNHVTPWTIRPQTIQSMEFSRPEYWSVEPFPSPGDLPKPRIEPRSLALQEDSLPAEPQGKPTKMSTKIHIVKGMVFLVVVYRYENWTIKKPEHPRIDVLKCTVGEDS